jgi:hypothetical protein
MSAVRRLCLRSERRTGTLPALLRWSCSQWQATAWRPFPCRFCSSGSTTAPPLASFPIGSVVPEAGYGEGVAPLLLRVVHTWMFEGRVFGMMALTGESLPVEIMTIEYDAGAAAVQSVDGGLTLGPDLETSMMEIDAQEALAPAVVAELRVAQGLSATLVRRGEGVCEEGLYLEGDGVGALVEGMIDAEWLNMTFEPEGSADSDEDGDEGAESELEHEHEQFEFAVLLKLPSVSSSADDVGTGRVREYWLVAERDAMDSLNTAELVLSSSSSSSSSSLSSSSPPPPSPPSSPPSPSPARSEDCGATATHTPVARGLEHGGWATHAAFAERFDEERSRVLMHVEELSKEKGE